VRDALISLGADPSPNLRDAPKANWQRIEADRMFQIAKRARQARSLWDQTHPITGSVAERYLRSRGITCDLADSLRFAPQCWHATAKRFPAMVARIDGGEGFAVHRTYLNPNCKGKADATPPKAM
jgi:hypothetical protein